MIYRIIVWLPYFLCVPSFTDALLAPQNAKDIGSLLHLPLPRDVHLDDVLPDSQVQTQRPPVFITRRRQLLNLGFYSTLVAPVLLHCNSPSWASNPFAAESTSLATGLLNSRVTENLLSPPSYGMESSDIFYPSWFLGSWKVFSETIDVQAPCGTALFGGNATYEKARDEIGTTLTYNSRFISDNNGDDRVIADREYNVQSIAKAAMGQYSVLDIPGATPNKLTCILAPNGSPRMLKVDLIALNRRQETISDEKFDCSEVTREIIAPINNNNNNQRSASTASSPGSGNTVLKEVETTSLYTYNSAKNEITCQQRSATFLLPSQNSPMANKMWEASRGRPIDTRFYNVRYTKL